MPTTQNSRQALRNEKMIEVRVRFWTNIAETAGEIIPKHSWDAGVVLMKPNVSHGIKPGKAKPFHSMMELPAVIEKVLHKHGIKLRHGKSSRKYFADGD